MSVKRGKAHHPVQPLITANDGIIRFKSNKIVEFLIDAGPFDLNQLARMNFSNEDWEQFSQLTGYSLDGWGTLSYVSNRAWKQVSDQPVYGKQRS